MSPNTVDTRVVDMKFNNSNFEKNISTSMDSLKRFDSTLTGLEKSRSLDTLNKQAQNMDFSKMNNGIDSVKAHFSAMQVVGMTVISELTKKAMQFGSNLVKNTFGQIKSGGIKRALNLEQAEFQVTGLTKKGQDAAKTWKSVLEDVSYAVDGTAYGLDEASKVASQLMASEVHTGKQMKTALRGISGMAAMTGRTYSDIGNIFTKVAGNGRLMSQELLQFSASGLNAAATLTDYLNKNEKVRESIIGVGLQSKKGAKDVKNFAKSSKLTEQNIRTLVSAGAIDFKTFSKAMDDAFGDHATKANETYTGSLMNVKAALSRIGEPIATNVFDNLRDIFNVLIPIINGVKKELAPILDYFNELTNTVGKFVQTNLKKLTIVYEKIDGKKTITGIKEIHKAFIDFSEIFKSTVNTVSKSVQSFESGFISIGKIIESLKEILGEVFGKTSEKNIDNIGKAIKLIGNIFSSTFSIIYKLLNVFKPLISSILILIKSIYIAIYTTLGDALKSLDGGLSKSKGLKTFTEYVKNCITYISKLILSIANLIQKTKILKAIISLVGGIFNGLGYVLKNVGNIIKDVVDEISNLFNKLKNGLQLSEIIQNVISNIKNGIQTVVKILNQNSDTVIRGSIFALLIVKIRQLTVAFNNLKSSNPLSMLKSVPGIFSNLSRATSNLADSFWSLQKNIQYKSLKEIAAAVLMLAVAMVLISGIKESKLDSSIVAVETLLTSVVLAFASLEKTLNGKTNIKATFVVNQISEAITSLSIAILILSYAMKNISKIDKKQLNNALIAISVLLGELTGIIILLSRTVKNAVKGSSTLIVLALSIKMLTDAVIILSALSWDKLIRGLTAVGALLVGIAGFMTILSLVGKKLGSVSLRTSISIIAVSKSIEMISESVKSLGDMSWGQIGKGLATVGIILYGIAGYITLVSLVEKKIGKNSIKTALAILVIAKSLTILSKVVETLGNLSWDVIGTGLSTIGIMLSGLLVFVILLRKYGKVTLKSAVGLYVIAEALQVLSNIVLALGGASISTIIKGLVSFIVLLGSLAAALFAMNKAKGGAIALVIASSAIVILTASLLLLSTVPAAALASGVFAIVAALLAFAVASTSLQASIPTMLSFASAMVLVGVSIALLGVGILSLAAGLTMLVNLIVSIGVGIKDIVVALATGVVEFIKTIVVGIAEIAPDLIKTVLILAKGAIKILGEIVPSLIVTVVEIITKSLRAIADNSGPIVTSIIDIIIGIINGVASRIGDLLGAIWNLLGSIGKTILKALGDVKPEEIVKLVLAVGLIGVVFVILGKLKTQLMQAILSIALMSVALLMLTGVFALMSLIPMNLADTLSSLTKFVVGMAAAMLLTSLVPAPAAISGIISMGIFIAGLTAILIALGAISKIPGLTWIVGEGGKLLSQLGYILGAFISSILAGLSSGFPTIMANLSAGLIALTVGLKPFVKAISNIPLDGVVKLGLLAAMIGVITAVGFIQSILKFSLLGDPIDAFNNSLIKLAVGIAAFAKETAKINATKMLVLSAALKILADVQSILLRNKLISFFAGKVDYKGFSKGIVGMAFALKNFCTLMANEKVDEKRMLTFAKILKNLAEVQHLMPRKGGWLQKIAGTTDAKMFEDSATAMINALKQLSDKTSEIKNPGKLDTFLGLIKKLVEIAKAIPKSGGLAQKIKGVQDIEGFAKGIDKLGTSFKSMADKAEEISDPEKVDIFVGWIAKLGKVLKSLPATGGWAGFFAGDEDLEDLSDGVESLSETFKTVDEELPKDISKVDKFVSMISVIASSYKSLTKSIKDNTDKKTEEYEDPIAKMTDPLKESMIKLKEFVESFKMDFLTEAINIFDQLHTFIYTVGFKFSDKKTTAYLKSIVNLSEGMKEVAEAIKAIQTAGLQNFNLKDSKSKVNSLIPNNEFDLSGNKKPQINEKSDKNYFGGLASAITDFANAMKSVDIKELSKARDKINIVSSIKDFKSNKFGNLKASISNLKSASTEMVGLSNVLDEKGKKKGLDKEQLNTITSKIKEYKVALDNVSKTINGDKNGKGKLDTKSIKKFSSTINEFSDALSKIAEAFKSIEDTDTVKNAGQKIKDAMTKVGKSSISSFLKPIRKGEGTKATVKSAFNTFKNLIIKKINGLGGKDGDIYKTSLKNGAYIIDGLKQGIEDNSDKVVKAIKKASKGVIKGAEITFEINSPSKVFKRIGKFTIQGFINGVENNRVKAIKATKNTFSAIINAAKKEMIAGGSQLKSFVEQFFPDYKSYSAKDLKKTITKSSKALSDAAYGLYKKSDPYKEDSVAQKTLRSDLKKQNSYIKKNENKVSKKSLENLEKEYKEKRKRRIAAEKADEKHSTKRSRATLKRAKKYEEIYEKRYKKKKKLQQAKEKRAQDKEDLKALNKQVEENIKNTWNDFVTNIKNNVADFVNPFSIALDLGVNLLQKFDRQTRISSKRFLYNMKSNVKAVEEYNTLLAAAEKKGLAKDFLNDIKDMGMDGMEYLRAIVSMKEDDVLEANALYYTNQEQLLDKWIRDMKDKATKVEHWQQKLNDLASMGYSAEVIEKIASMGIEEGTAYIDALLIADDSKIADINATVAKNLSMDASISKKVANTYAATAGGIITTLSKTLNEDTTVPDAANKLGAKILGKLQNYLSSKEGASLSQQTLAGIEKGIKDAEKTKKIKALYKALGYSTINAFKKALGIKSPSREFILAAGYTIAGLVEGVDKNKSRVESAYRALGEVAIASANSIMEDSINTPVITPVVDLSEVENSADGIGSMFDSSIVMKTSSSFANGQNQKNNLPTQIINNYNNEFNQNNYSPDPLDRTDIYRDTKSLIGRNWKGELVTS